MLPQTIERTKTERKGFDLAGPKSSFDTASPPYVSGVAEPTDIFANATIQALAEARDEFREQFKAATQRHSDLNHRHKEVQARLKDMQFENIRLKEERSQQTTLIPSGTTPDEYYARSISCLNQNLSELAYEIACSGITPDHLSGTTTMQQRAAVKHVLVNALWGAILKPFCPGLPEEADHILGLIRRRLKQGRK